MVGHTTVPRTRIDRRDPQRPHRPAPQHRGRVDRLPDPGTREPEPGARAEVARTLRDHHHVRAQHVPGGQQAGVHVDRLQVPPERLPAGHHPGPRV